MSPEFRQGGRVSTWSAADETTGGRYAESIRVSPTNISPNTKEPELRQKAAVPSGAEMFSDSPPQLDPAALSDPEKVAAAVAFVCSPLSSAHQRSSITRGWRRHPVHRLSWPL